MSRRMVPVTLGLIVFPLAAIFIGGDLVVAAGQQLMAVARDRSPARSILVAATVAMVKGSRHEDWLWSQQDAIRGIAGKAETALARITALEPRTAWRRRCSGWTRWRWKWAPCAARCATRCRRCGGPHPRASAMPNPHRRRRRSPKRQSRRSARRPSRPSCSSGREQLTLMPSPSSSFPTGTTTHYRALLGLATAAATWCAMTN